MFCIKLNPKTYTLWSKDYIAKLLLYGNITNLFSTNMTGRALLSVFVMICCDKMHCSLPHIPYFCSLPSPVCLLHLLTCTCVDSSPIACPPSSVVCWYLLWFLFYFRCISLFFLCACFSFLLFSIMFLLLTICGIYDRSTRGLGPMFHSLKLWCKFGTVGYKYENMYNQQDNQKSFFWRKNFWWATKICNFVFIRFLTNTTQCQKKNANFPGIELWFPSSCRGVLLNLLFTIVNFFAHELHV